MTKYTAFLTAVLMLGAFIPSDTFVYAEESSLTEEISDNKEDKSDKEDTSSSEDKDNSDKEQIIPDEEEKEEEIIEEEPPKITHTITFLDFEGKVMDKIVVNENEPIDYSVVDTTVLQNHIDTYTEMAFSSWDNAPETTDHDITLKALYKIAKISLESVPDKKIYFSRNGKIDKTGLKVLISVTTQTNEKDSKGNYILVSDEADVSASCKTVPSNLSDAFMGTNKAEINIVPIGQNQSIYSYQIECYDFIGDIDRSRGVDAADASSVLTTYAVMSTQDDYTVSADYLKRADFNMDGAIDATDASAILSYYALTSVDNTLTLEDYIQTIITPNN